MKSRKVAAAGLVVVLLFTTAVFLARDVLLPRRLTRMVRERTGLEAAFDSLRVRLLSPSVEVRGLTLRDPAGEGTEILYADLLFAKAGWRGLLGSEVRLRELRAEVARLTLPWDDARGSILDSAGRRIRESLPSPAPETPPVAPGDPADGPPEPRARTPRSLRIDTLALRIGEVRLQSADRAGGGGRVLPLGVDTTYSDVTRFEPVLADLGARVAMAALPGLMEELRGSGDGEAFDMDAARDRIRGLRDQFRRMRREEP